jgi:hypothetical protein
MAVRTQSDDIIDRIAAAVPQHMDMVYFQKRLACDSTNKRRAFFAVTADTLGLPKGIGCHAGISLIRLGLDAFLPWVLVTIRFLSAVEQASDADIKS